MNNPLVGGTPQIGNGMPNNSMAQMMQRFQQFRQTFSGDPRQQIQQLMNSGKISQSDYDNAVQMAQQFQRMMGGK